MRADQHRLQGRTPAGLKGDHDPLLDPNLLQLWDRPAELAVGPRGTPYRSAGSSHCDVPSSLL